MRGHEFVGVDGCSGCDGRFCDICGECRTVDCSCNLGAHSPYPDDNPKTIYGVEKPPLNLIPPIALVEESKAFGNGAEKYGPFNWREKTVSVSIYVAAAMRHLLAYWDGEDLAQDSKVHHLAHARACMAIVLDAGSLGKLNDDRPPKGRNGL